MASSPNLLNFIQEDGSLIVRAQVIATYDRDENKSNPEPEEYPRQVEIPFFQIIKMEDPVIVIDCFFEDLKKMVDEVAKKRKQMEKIPWKNVKT